MDRKPETTSLPRRSRRVRTVPRRTVSLLKTPFLGFFPPGTRCFRHGGRPPFILLIERKRRRRHAEWCAKGRDRRTRDQLEPPMLPRSLSRHIVPSLQSVPLRWTLLAIVIHSLCIPLCALVSCNILDSWPSRSSGLLDLRD